MTDIAPAPDAQPEAAPALSPEQGRIADLEAQLAAANSHILAAVPDHLRPLIPNSNIAERLDWISRAKAAGLFASNVPTTDSGRVPMTPRSVDVFALPATARLAAGYR